MRSGGIHVDLQRQPGLLLMVLLMIMMIVMLTVVATRRFDHSAIRLDTVSASNEPLGPTGQVPWWTACPNRNSHSRGDESSLPSRELQSSKSLSHLASGPALMSMAMMITIKRKYDNDLLALWQSPTVIALTPARVVVAVRARLRASLLARVDPKNNSK